MTKTALNIKRGILFIGDILILQIALVLSLALRYQSLDLGMLNVNQLPFFVISILWAIGLFVTGLYDLSRAQNTLNFFRTFLEGMFINLLIAAAFFYLIPIFGIEPRTILMVFFAVSLLLIYCWRMIFNSFIAKGFLRSRLLFIGPYADAVTLIDQLKTSALGFELATVIYTTPRTSHEADGIHWTNNIAHLPNLIQEDRINAVVLGSGIDEFSAVRDALYQSLFTSVSLLDRKELEEILTGRIPVAEADKTWFLRNLKESEKTWFETTKRVFDVILAIPFAIFTIAITPIVAVLIKASSPGTIFYTHERIGKHGKHFLIWKFRTMKQDAESNGAQFATKNDPRITSVGKILRGLRIDELPQIWNVLRGDMSFVGPRPERPEFVDQITQRMPYYTLRFLARPGLTGWAQVKYRYTSSIDDSLIKLQYDLYYVKHRSLILDGAILLKTINTVLRSQGT